MKTLILSAGKGERLLPLTKDRPKILVELGDGTTLLSRQYASLCKIPELGEIIVAAGHCAEKVTEYIETLGATGIRMVYNPFYGISGPLVTLWVALRHVGDADFIFMNGDTLYSKKLYEQVLETYRTQGEGVFLFCSKIGESYDDDVLVRLDSNGAIIEANKGLGGCSLESTGLVLVKGAGRHLIEVVEKIARTKEFLEHNLTWHSLFAVLYSEGYGAKPVLVPQEEWLEVDIHHELVELREILKHKVESKNI